MCLTIKMNVTFYFNLIIHSLTSHLLKLFGIWYQLNINPVIAIFTLQLQLKINVAVVHLQRNTFSGEKMGLNTPDLL